MYGKFLLYKNFEVEVFEDTISQYKTKFASDTDMLKQRDTIVYDTIDGVDFTPNKDMQISIVNDGTVNAGRKAVENANGGRVAILNFADAIEPGGLVLVGETTQEENICRCSNLYASITTEKAYDEYYKINAKSVSGIYTDRIIYSKDVTFFKDDVTYENVEPYKMDVITCPAPSARIMNKQTEYMIIRSRIENIIKSAILNGVRHIILGAWGCGAFGQNPVVVSQCFMSVLKVYNAFDTVVFAIRNCNADNVKSSNYIAFNDTISKS